MRLRILYFICVLLLAACNTQANRNQSPTRTGITIRAATPETRPSINIAATPLPTRTVAALQQCNGAVDSILIVQERGRVTFNGERLRLRQGPGTDYEMVALMEPGELFMVLDGPACAEGYSWYRIRFGRLSGWIAEGDEEEYFAEPYLPN